MTTPPPPPSPAHAPKRSWWRAVWVLPVALLIVGVAIGSSASPREKTVAGPTMHVTTTATATATATATVTTTPTQVIATHTVVQTVTYTPPVKVAFSDGTFRVGSEIQPGTYHTEGGDCYYERRRQGDGIDAIIANDNITGPTTIDIRSSDYAFKSSGGCAWSRVG